MRRKNFVQLILVMFLLIFVFRPLDLTKTGEIKQNFSIKAPSGISSTQEQVQNGNFETGSMANWVENDRITTDVNGITEASFEVNGDLPHAGYSSLHLYARGENGWVGAGGDLAVVQNISLNQPPTEYNLTGHVYVSQCTSDSDVNWVGVVISFFDGSQSELGRIYYQFADYGTTGDLYPNEIDLYNQSNTWLRFNRNLSRDYIDEFSGDPNDITQIELAFFVRVADGTSVGDEGFCEAYYDNWYFDAKNHPLRLVRNEDFAALGFPGSGTEIDPYRIENFEIEMSSIHLIDIENTTDYFLIRNCNLKYLGGTAWYYCGIQFKNVSHGTILENHIENCIRGIEINIYSLHNNVSWNNITGCSQFAFLSEYSNYTIFEGNQIHDNNQGLDLTHSYHNIIRNNKVYNQEIRAISLAVSSFNVLEDNEVYNCTMGIGLHSHANNNSIVNNSIHSIGSDISFSGEGVYIYDDCRYNNISWNTISDNGGKGIFAEDILGDEIAAVHTFISHNNISNCRDGAILLQSSPSSSIQYNTFYNNTDDGSDHHVYLSDSDNSLVTFNTFIKNYPIRISGSSGTNISWNDFIGRSWCETVNSQNTFFDSNYYDGYYSSDINPAGFYNEPKDIYDGIEDTHPLTAPSNTAMAFMKYLTVPRIVYPSLDLPQDLFGVITIRWLESYGCPGEGITYSVYYMDTASDQSYTQIVAGLTTTQYDWDTTTVPDGDQYAIKVVASYPGVESAEWSVGNILRIWNEDRPTEPTTEEPTTTISFTPSWTILISLLALAGIFIRRKK